MGVGAFLEPLIVVSLLAGGTILNRDRPGSGRRGGYEKTIGSSSSSPKRSFAGDALDAESGRRWSGDGDDTMPLSPWSADSLGGSSTTLLSQGDDNLGPRWRQRTLRLWKWEKKVITPNTEVFEDRLLSRVLRRLPFLVEAWYWALIYWVYQVGRAIGALAMDESTVDVARRHALQLIHLEQRLHIFVERPVQEWFLQHATLMRWTNRAYSFVHIPGSILFLVVFYYLTTTRPRRNAESALPSKSITSNGRPALNPALYEQRRRTMAMCNLFAFIIFTCWPCMPPRLLSDPTYNGPDAKEAKSYGFVDTVHGADGESSVWTTNRFCNQYAAMPSLHFGYSLLIGLTVATMPVQFRGWKRMALIVGGMAYPGLILTAIVATANHFVLDAVAGACVVAVAWHAQGIMLNLLVLEDYFLRLVRIHKPSKELGGSRDAPIE
ncbi:integral membrane protein [Diaporthe helianthi]|uniref:Integral membrane protein n=1 Tax=Diaporthe helianthi TaxID=158607 RepID=A0A2P5HEX5_DIAHE|nr:integral membrane protein [Diaporthe helianthi]